MTEYRKLQKAQIAGIIALVFGFVVIVIGLIYAALPILNNGIVTGQPLLNTTNASGPGYLACLSNCGGANFSGYPGGIGIGQATYIVTVMGLLAGGALLVSGLLGGRL